MEIDPDPSKVGTADYKRGVPLDQNPYRQAGDSWAHWRSAWFREEAVHDHACRLACCGCEPKAVEAYLSKSIEDVGQGWACPAARCGMGLGEEHIPGCLFDAMLATRGEG